MLAIERRLDMLPSFVLWGDWGRGWDTYMFARNSSSLKLSPTASRAICQGALHEDRAAKRFMLPDLFTSGLSPTQPRECAVPHCIQVQAAPSDEVSVDALRYVIGCSLSS